MRLRFLSTCTDKHTGKTYERDQVYEFEDARGQEILNTKHAVRVDAMVELPELPKEEPVEEVKEVQEEEPKTVDERLEDGEMINLNDLSINELRKMAKEVGIDSKGTKEELIERIAEEVSNA